MIPVAPILVLLDPHVIILTSPGSTSVACLRGLRKTNQIDTHRSVHYFSRRAMHNNNHRTRHYFSTSTRGMAVLFQHFSRETLPSQKNTFYAYLNRTIIHNQPLLRSGF